MTLIPVPNDFGQGGANIGDGEPRLAEVLQGLTGGVTDASAAADNANNAAIGAQGQAFAAAQKGIWIDQAFQTSDDVAGLPPGVKSTGFEFNEGVPLDSAARFVAVTLLLPSVVWDNAGHTGIRAAVGTHSDHEKYMSFTSIAPGATTGTEFTGGGDGGMFMMCPIGSDVPVLTIESDDDLNTITQGQISAKVFYSKP